eukprot:m.1442591 g.1442591  ORF g.1442591 m.1442591 type:complete len:272 (+) comp25097_c0_seq13:2036-2851(+)
MGQLGCGCIQGHYSNRFHGDLCEMGVFFLCVTKQVWERCRLFTAANKHRKSFMYRLDPDRTMQMGCALVATPYFAPGETVPPQVAYVGPWDVEPMFEYINKNVKMWYHMDKHVFSLLLACLLVVLSTYTYVGVAVGVLLGGTILIKCTVQGVFPAHKMRQYLTRIEVMRDSLASYRPVHFFLKADLKLIQLCRHYADSIVAILLIFGLVVATLTVGTIVVVRVHMESTAIMGTIGKYAVDVVHSRYPRGNLSRCTHRQTALVVPSLVVVTS